MSEVTCKTIIDILPLYVDGVVSEDTRDMVAEHLEHCAECREKYEKMKDEITFPIDNDVKPLLQFKNEVAKGKKRAFRKGFIIAIVCAVVLLCGILGGYLYARNLPVDWDAGACGGGYATFIFDKYSDELVQKYLNGSADKENITSIEAVRGTQTAEWEGQTIFLQFDIEYQHSTQGKVTERVRFVGQRTWFDTYDWSGAIIEGDKVVKFHGQLFNKSDLSEETLEWLE